MTGPGPEFLVLTGFLGSGKTTLLRDFIASRDAGDTAVIVNEVGEVGLDGALLREVGGDVAMTMLANGCICCELGSDLAVTVEALLAADRTDGAPALRRIVLETSGVSKPGPILRQLASLGRHRMRIAVVATYDPTREAAAGDFEEAAAQWAGAQRLVVTKADLVAPDALGSARDAAAALNALAEIVAETDRAETVRRTFAPPGAIRPGNEPAGRVPRTTAAAHPRLASLLLRPSGPIAYDDLAAWLDNLAGALGERLLRVKGLVATDASPYPLLVQSVGTLFSAPRPFPGGGLGTEPFLVVIARDLRPGEVEALTPRIALRAQAPSLRRPAPPRPRRAEAL